MLVIFASMLYEKRIIFISRRPSRLSACVQAANAIIYPMHWQHIYIPVLPKHLIDYLLAPMPFLIGVPTPIWEVSHFVTVTRDLGGLTSVSRADQTPKVVSTPREVPFRVDQMIRIVRKGLLRSPQLGQLGIYREGLMGQACQELRRVWHEGSWEWFDRIIGGRKVLRWKGRTGVTQIRTPKEGKILQPQNTRYKNPRALPH